MDLKDYRDPILLKETLSAIKKICTKKWRIMEICGGQTHAIMKYGLDQLLPIELLHGPGCPVCVTPIQVLDEAIELAKLPQVIFCTFSDMLRVPGNESDLLSAKAAGADVRALYSPLDALQIAQENPEKEVIFFAVGFETTAPANAMAVYLADQKKLKNFSVLVSQVLVPPAIEALLSNPKHQIDGFLAAGHVCTVMGYSAYEPIAEKHQIPIVITGFEPLDIVQGVYRCVEQLESRRHTVENQYLRSVHVQGNLEAIKMLKEIFRICDKDWRGLGNIPQSGWELQPQYSQFDARKKFTLKTVKSSKCNLCISGEVLQGLKKPSDCPQFAKACTPENPLGATMVSGEGACSAYYLYKEHQ
jgi:hydrogenase expression/formation protein HypD